MPSGEFLRSSTAAGRPAPGTHAGISVRQSPSVSIYAESVLVPALFGLLVLPWAAVRAFEFSSSVPGFQFLASTIATFRGAQPVALDPLVREGTSTGESTSEGHFVDDGDE